MVRTSMLRKLSLDVCLAGILGAQAFGQTIIVPNANATVAGNGSSGPLPSTPVAYESQIVVDPSQFAPAGGGLIYITGFSLRAAPGTGPLNLTLSGSLTLSTSPNYPSTSGGHTLLSTTFANNVGPDKTLVAAGTVTINGPGCAAPGPCPFANPIEFATPFLYNPKNGPLLADLKASLSATSGQLDIVNCNAPGCSIASAVSFPLGSPVTFSYGGSILQFTYAGVATIIPHVKAGAAGGDSSGPLPSPALSNAEFQQMFGNGQFPAGPVYITGLTYRAAPGKGPLSVTASGNIYMSTSPTYPNTIGGQPLMSTTFASNVGPDNTLVLSGNVNINGAACAGPAPCPWANVLTLAKPFFYDPANGPLLVDFKFTSFGGSGQFDVVDCAAPGCVLANIDGTLGSATAAGFNYGGNVTLLTFTPVKPVTPAPTTNFTYTANVLESSAQSGHLVGAAPVTVPPFGNATGRLNVVWPLDQNGSPSGYYQVTMVFTFNEADSFSANGSLPSIKNGVAETFAANIFGGTGAFLGASGSANLTLTVAKGAGGSLTGNGNITINQKNTAISFLSSFPDEGPFFEFSSIMVNGTANMGALGTAGLQSSVWETVLGDPNSKTQAWANFHFNPNDSFLASFQLPAPASGPPQNLQGVIVGGTGAFAAASGTLTLNVASSSSGSTASGSGSITIPAPSSPTITSVNTAYGPGVTAQNTWLEIKGNNLVPSATPSSGVDWSNAPDFASGKMPTLLNGVSVTINGKPAYVYFFCSAVSASICPVDQINVLAPLDTTLGGVTVVVTSPTGTSAPYFLRMETNSPAFLLFDVHGDIAARHLDYSLLGPTSLYPGLSTPAKAGETILLAGIGFGLPTTTLVDGSSSQLGPLPVKPICFIGPNQATVVDASVVSPGLYQLILTVPTGTPSGDNLVTCAYQGNALIPSSTPAGAVINVQ